MTKKQFILSALLAGVCNAQLVTSHVSIETQANAGLTSQIGGRLTGILANLRAINLRPVVTGSWEEQVLKAAEHGVGKTLVLRLADLNPPTINTTSSSEGDVLVALWNTTPGRLEKRIWLWDTPSRTTFIIEVDASLLQRKELADYCETLFVWNNFIGLKSLKLIFSRTDAGHERATGSAGYLQTSRGLYQLGLGAEAIEGRGYIAVYMSKSLFSYPPEADGVPERFPPLRAKLDGMSSPALLSELGKGYNLQATLMTYPRNRDAILLTELLSRGPVSDSELSEIVLGKFGDGNVEHTEVILLRFNALLEALEERRQLTTYLPELERLLNEDVAPIAGSMSNPIVGRFFAVMDKNKIDATPAALAFLEQGKFVPLSLLYLQKNAGDSATLKRLAELHVAAEFQDAKTRTVETIQWRLSSQK